MPPIATGTGTFLAAGVSANGRLYTEAAIDRAVARMAERIAAGGLPVTMLTHHGAEDDSTRIVGRVTKAWRDGPKARFAYELADSAGGRDIAALASSEDPSLDSVSIRGWWLGEVRTVEHEGAQVETADDLEIDGIDWTKSPGVTAARIDSLKTVGESAGRHPIYESVDETYLSVSVDPDWDSAASVTAVAAGLSAMAASMTTSPGACPHCGATIESTTDPKEAPVAETQTTPVTAGAPPAPVALGEAAIAAIVDGVLAALRPSSATPETDATTTTTPSPAETLTAKAIEDMKAELKAEIVQAYGLPRRKGFVPETAGAPRALHEMSDEEFRSHVAAMADRLIPGAPPSVHVIDG